MQTEKRKRGRPAKEVTEVRNVVVHTNLTVAEKWKVSSDAEAAGLTVSDYIRSKII
jgi:hypothetical protein